MASLPRPMQQRTEPENPHLPHGTDPLLFNQFQGMDQSGNRFSVEAKQIWWCDGWFPLDHEHLRTLPGVGTAIYTTVSTNQIVFFDFANVNTAPLAIVFLADGSVYQVNTTSSVATQIAPAGTILDPTRANCDVSQWGNQYVLIVADQINGYFIWDGALLYKAGTLSPFLSFSYNGFGYTDVPTVTAYGGAGTGASVTATEAGGIVTGASVTSVGSGYLATDVVGLAFSGGGITAKTAILTPTVVNGAVSTVSITDGGLGYTSAARASVFGGGGTGVTLTLGITSTSISAVTVTAGGSGFASTPTVLVTDPNNRVARASITLMPIGVQGNTIETYQGRVWIASGPIVYFSSPGNVADFSTSLGGGNFTSTDSYLRIGFTELKSLNGFLYLVADSSINYISGVQTSGTPATTTFSNQNADPESGSSWSGSVINYGRSIFYANSFGVHSLVGANSEKFSVDIDNVYGAVPNFGGLSLSSAKATIYNRKCYMVLVPIINPYTKQQENKLLLFHDKKWFASSQDITLNYIASQEINSNLTAWGTNGLSLYPLFQQPSTAFTKTVQTKYWDYPSYMFGKAVSRFWSVWNFSNTVTSAATVTMTVDSERTSAGYTLTSPLDTILVKNASLVTIPVVNASSVTILTKSLRGNFWVTDPMAVGQQGDLLGLTFQTSYGDITLCSATIRPEITQYRG